MERKLAHIELVKDIRPIEGADRIEQVHILGWNVITQKGEFQPNEKCIYVEIDSQLPESDKRFAFLEKRGYRIKTQKMRGVLSQGIVFSLKDFPECAKYNVGDDVTNKLKITKAITAEERRLMAEEQLDDEKRAARLKMRLGKFIKTRFGKWLMKHSLSRKILLRLFGGKKVKRQTFPDWIQKTDEERIQNLPDYCKLTCPFFATEKVDGTSSTFAVKRKNNHSKKFEFIVCSRNVRQVTPNSKNFHTEELGGNVYWEIAQKYNIRAALESYATAIDATTVVLQGEILGVGLQGNRYKFNDHRFRGYTLVVDGVRVDTLQARNQMKMFNIPWVPILESNFYMLPTVDDMLAYAEGWSLISEEQCPREGIVFRAVGNPDLSFKAVSNSFLLEKHPDVYARDMARKKELEMRESMKSKN